MIRGAISLTSDVNQIALAWLDTYTSHYGDVSPNSTMVKMNINFKKECYEQYKRETKEHGKFVSYSRFCELWNVLFPNCLNRPWCNIPGKCETCYQIDKGRRDSTSLKEQKYYQQCHAIHRGGLFNLERKM